MKKVSFLAILALLLSACGSNTRTAGQTAVQTETQPAGHSAAISAEQFAEMQELYEDSEDDHGWEPLCKWQYVDLDGDGINEIWMRDAAEEYGAFFSLVDGTVSLIGVETERFQAYTREQKDGKGYFCKGGSAGGPSYYTEIVAVKDSRVVERFNQLQVYEDIEEASLNGESIGQDGARAYLEALPESADLIPGEWHMLEED